MASLVFGSEPPVFPPGCAVSHPKPRDLRPPSWMSPRSHFPTSQQCPTPNHVTSGPPKPAILFPPSLRCSILNHVTSGSRDVPSGDVPSGSGDVTSAKPRDFRFPEPAILFPDRSAVPTPGCYDNPSINQKPSALDQSNHSTPKRGRILHMGLHYY